MILSKIQGNQNLSILNKFFCLMFKMSGSGKRHCNAIVVAIFY